MRLSAKTYLIYSNPHFVSHESCHVTTKRLQTRIDIYTGKSGYSSYNLRMLLFQNNVLSIFQVGIYRYDSLIPTSLVNINTWRNILVSMNSSICLCLCL